MLFFDNLAAHPKAMLLAERLTALSYSLGHDEEPVIFSIDALDGQLKIADANRTHDEIDPLGLAVTLNSEMEDRLRPELDSPDLLHR